MGWKQNLLSNLLTIAILLTLGIIVYCKIKKVTLGEMIKSIKEALS